MKAINPKLKPSEFVFLLAGAGMLASIPFLGVGGFGLWIAVKAVYLGALLLAILKR